MHAGVWEDKHGREETPDKLWWEGKSAEESRWRLVSIKLLSVFILEKFEAGVGDDGKKKWWKNYGDLLPG